MDPQVVTGGVGIVAIRVVFLPRVAVTVPFGVWKRFPAIWIHDNA
jgi:hypothetical protein